MWPDMEDIEESENYAKALVDYNSANYTLDRDKVINDLSERIIRLVNYHNELRKEYLKQCCIIRVLKATNE